MLLTPQCLVIIVALNSHLTVKEIKKNVKKLCKCSPTYLTFPILFISVYRSILTAFFYSITLWILYCKFSPHFIWKEAEYNRIKWMGPFFFTKWLGAVLTFSEAQFANMWDKRIELDFEATSSSYILWPGDFLALTLHFKIEHKRNTDQMPPLE